ncbi:MAG: nitroreductase family deazaflavin-dependent oxidoreductase [Anaerolineae bacterium]|nr:nitroreductase family deazaflavin-dependent oxidoreductase [Anaerolineae bacterium]
MAEGKVEAAQDILPYPANPALKLAFRLPILLWRLGLGPVLGRLFLILTTTGRKTGLPRRVAVEYHAWRGRKYIASGWGDRPQWYRNLLADPHVTIQTADGVERCVARRVVDDVELAEVFAFIEDSPAMRRWAEALGAPVTREAFLAEKGRFYWITFDPTDEPTPPPLEVDLAWVWGLLAVVVLGRLAGRVARRRRREGGVPG